MKLKHIVVSMENHPGRLYEVTKALGDAKINLRALNLADTGAFGELRLLVSDVPKARRILMKMEIPAFVNEVVAVKIDDRPSSLAELLKPMVLANVHVVFMYAYTRPDNGYATMIFRFSNNEKAIEVLKAHQYVPLNNENFGILDRAA